MKEVSQATVCRENRYRYFYTGIRILIPVMLFFIFFPGVSLRAEPLKIGVAGYEQSQTVRKVCRVLRRLGVDAVPVDSTKDNLEDLDGLVLPGGPDINPGWYSEENTACEGMRNSLDYIQFSVLDAFLKTGKPVLGICRGMQLINVYFGGTLNQNIEGHREGRHIVENLPGTWCSDILGPSVETNSSHHQSLKEPGDGVVVCARAFDTPGTIEAIRQEHLPVYAVQWHPENKPHDVGDTLLRGWLKITQIHKSVDQFLKSGVWQ